jgi:hypothetical protein
MNPHPDRIADARSALMGLIFTQPHRATRAADITADGVWLLDAIRSHDPTHPPLTWSAPHRTRDGQAGL